MEIETLYSIKNLSLIYRYFQFIRSLLLLNFTYLRKRKA